MKYLITCLMLLVSSLMVAQVTPASNAFASTTYSFNLSPITLPGSSQTLSGAETDIMVHFTDNNIFGETTLISSAPFIGGRYERTFPVISDYLQNHTALTGGHFQVGVTVSLGVVKGDRSHWGERGGVFMKYAPNGSDNFNVGFEASWNNLPGIAHNIPSVVVGPNFRF